MPCHSELLSSWNLLYQTDLIPGQSLKKSTTYASESSHLHSELTATDYALVCLVRPFCSKRLYDDIK